jgi:hypothetical protein
MQAVKYSFFTKQYTASDTVLRENPAVHSALYEVIMYTVVCSSSSSIVLCYSVPCAASTAAVLQ